MTYQRSVSPRAGAAGAGRAGRPPGAGPSPRRPRRATGTSPGALDDRARRAAPTNRSTAASSTRQAVAQPVDRQLARAASGSWRRRPPWTAPVVRSAPAHPPAACRRRRSSTRVPSSSRRQRAPGEPPHEHLRVHRVVEPQPAPRVRQSRPRRGRARRRGRRPRRRWTPCGPKSLKSTTRRVSAIAPADQATTGSSGEGRDGEQPQRSAAACRRGRRRSASTDALGRAARRPRRGAGRSPRCASGGAAVSSSP